MRALRLALAAFVVFALAACGEPSKEDVIEKSRGVETRAALEKKIGKPADIQKLGPIELWRYRTKNGDVVFVITGERVALQAAE
ncbi:MAG: hypothetical protein ACKVSF_01160 [Alphaproteobacteria bacterium]